MVFGSFKLIGSVLAAVVTVASVDTSVGRDAYIDALLANMTVAELVHQLHLTLADNVVGQFSHNENYDSYVGNKGIGVIHDWYPTNTSQYNGLQTLNKEKMRLPIPFLQTGECLHGIGYSKGTIFPQQIGHSASFDTDLVQRVGRAIGSEARAIGIHACFSPVLDLGKDPRWGRVQEDFGEDFILTSHMGVAYASGLSKNGNWSAPDAVIPVMKHFAAHGSPQGGINAGPYMGFGLRQIMTEMLTPFKAAVELGGVKGVMMAYHDIDGVPSTVNPMLYKALSDWKFDGFVISDDTAVQQLITEHEVASSPASALSQWFNAGGAIQFYDFSLDVFTSTIQDLVSNGTVPLATLKERVRGVLNAKWYLGLFEDPLIPDGISLSALEDEHMSLALEAAQKSLVLLENRNNTLPIDVNRVKKVALVGPFVDIMNYGDYAGSWGMTTIDRAITLRAAMENYTTTHKMQLATQWGTNSWNYNGQYPISPDLLSPPKNASGTSQKSGGLLATYYADTNFSTPVFSKVETPNRDWGVYPPNGLPSNNFSLVYEGSFRSASDVENGWIGLVISPNSTGKLFVDGKLLVNLPFSSSSDGLGNILPIAYIRQNGTSPPPGSSPFTFKAGATHSIRIEYQVWNLAQKHENGDSVNGQIELFWNLVDGTPSSSGKGGSGTWTKGMESALEIAEESDLVIFVGGAAWNSDGESGDRGSLDLAPEQSTLLNALFDTGKPVALIVEGGRPFAIPDQYARSAAVMIAYFPGQAGGQAIADALFGTVNPSGRLPVTIPSSVGTIPSFYNYKYTAHGYNYTDIDSYPSYTFGQGSSYTTFERKSLSAQVGGKTSNVFSAQSSNITFLATIQNTGTRQGAFVAQVYLLRRQSTVVQPVRQLVGFQRVEFNPGEQKVISIDLDASRYLQILNRDWEWELEKGSYTFALCDNGSVFSGECPSVTLECM